MVEPFELLVHSPLMQLLWHSSALAAAAGKQTEPLLMRLDPASRAKVLMAILGLVVLGGGLIAMICLGARYVLRVAREPVRPARRGRTTGTASRSPAARRPTPTPTSPRERSRR